jgi:hypothetical protein
MKKKKGMKNRKMICPMNSSGFYQVTYNRLRKEFRLKANFIK